MDQLDRIRKAAAIANFKILQQRLTEVHRKTMKPLRSEHSKQGLTECEAKVGPTNHEVENLGFFVHCWTLELNIRVDLTY
jgi:hypothetical protein